MKSERVLSHGLPASSLIRQSVRADKIFLHQVKREEAAASKADAASEATEGASGSASAEDGAEAADADATMEA